MKSGNLNFLEPSGPFQACNGTALHYLLNMSGKAKHFPPLNLIQTTPYLLESSWNVMAHGDARAGKWRGNWRMEWVASTFHTTSENGVSSITTADAHTSAASSRLNWCPCRFKWTRPFRRKTKSGFCACAITFQTQSNTEHTCFSGVYTIITKIKAKYSAIIPGMDPGKRPPPIWNNNFEKEPTTNPKNLQLGPGSQSKGKAWAL
jgi:hypothetical protein